MHSHDEGCPPPAHGDDLRPKPAEKRSLMVVQDAANESDAAAIPAFLRYMPRAGHPDWPRLWHEAKSIAADLRPQLERLGADILCLQEVNAQRDGGKRTSRGFRARWPLQKGLPPTINWYLSSFGEASPES